MAYADTGRAIGAVTRIVQGQLSAKTTLNVTVGRPEPPQHGSTGPRLNLFLYEVSFDPSLKNTTLDEGRPAPLWLVVRYILTAFDQGNSSDTARAHEHLGRGIQALQEMNFLYLKNTMPADALAALFDSPETLKITFDETSTDLLSKLMQGSDEKYRCSIGFQVRPVLIAPAERPSYSLLVGVDYTATPPEIIGEEGVHLPVIPSLGPVVSDIEPKTFELGETITILGSDLHVPGLSVSIGNADLSVTMQRPDRLQCRVDGLLSGGTVISPGAHVVAVVETLATGRRRSSNPAIGRLLPHLDSVVPVSLSTVSATESNVHGTIDLNGRLLGTERDDIIVALYRENATVAMFDTIAPIVTSPPQTHLRLQIPSERAVPPGIYRFILRVNGQQAKLSPLVGLTV